MRQGNFVGAGVNTVTRSGTNSFSGSVYYQFRDESLVGTKAKNLTYNPGTFDYSNLGVWLGGPIIKNKLFFFGSFEDESLTQPGTTWTANPGGAPVVGNMTRVLASDLEQPELVPEVELQLQHRPATQGTTSRRPRSGTSASSTTTSTSATS